MQLRRQPSTTTWRDVFPSSLPPHPTPDKHVSDKYKKEFNTALRVAEKRLSKEKCAELFAKTAADLIAMLDNTEYRLMLRILNIEPRVR
jgi:hypothetical protein